MDQSETDKCHECGASLENSQDRCACDESICYNCCKCGEECVCGCKKRMKKGEENAEF
jgi:hypothetical protein